MWKIHEIRDDWGVGWQVETVIGKDADGGDILASVPHTFTDYQTAERVRHRLNEGESICCWCDNFKLGSCVLNCENECEEEYFGAFEHTPLISIDAARATIDRNRAESARDIGGDKLTAEKKSANTGKLRAFSRAFDFWAMAALMFIAAMVFVGLMKGWNMWGWIGSYWAVLTVSRINLFFAHRGLEKEE